MDMDKRSRREFLKATGAGALAVGLGATSPPASEAGTQPRAAQGISAVAGSARGAGQGTPPPSAGTIVWRGEPDYEATRRHMVWNQRGLAPATY
jgi:hypothetical protein